MKTYGIKRVLTSGKSIAASWLANASLFFGLANDMPATLNNTDGIKDFIVNIISNWVFWVFIISLFMTYTLIRLKRQADKIKTLEEEQIRSEAANEYLTERNNDLSKKQEANEQEIKKILTDISNIENENNIPFFKGKFFLHFVHIQNKLSKVINNNVDLQLLSVQNTISQPIEGSTRRDTYVTQIIQGVLQEDSYHFRFILSGETTTSCNDLHIVARDLINNADLIVKKVEHGIDGIVKELLVSYNKDCSIAKKGEYFRIELTWTWPNMLDIREDYIAGSNFISQNTQKLVLSLKKDQNQIFNKVSIFKYNVSMIEPEYITDILINEKTSMFTFECNSPDDNTEYIMYYCNE